MGEDTPISCCCAEWELTGNYACLGYQNTICTNGAWTMNTLPRVPHSWRGAWHAQPCHCPNYTNSTCWIMTKKLRMPGTMPRMGHPSQCKHNQSLGLLCGVHSCVMCTLYMHLCQMLWRSTDSTVVVTRRAQEAANAQFAPAHAPHHGIECLDTVLAMGNHHKIWSVGHTQMANSAPLVHV